MKKLCLSTLVFFVIAITGFTQNNKVVNAYNYLRNGQLDKAKENIDAAVLHPQTSGQAKTWLYKGNVYLAIALTDDAKYKTLDPDPLKQAYDAYQKCIEIDKDYIQPTANPPSAMLGLFVIGEQHYNRGVEYFNSKRFDLAIGEFEQTKKINAIFGQKDSLATFNAAICAIQINDTEKAIQYLRELISMNYMNPLVYSYLSTLYKDKGETDNALKVIKGGKTKFPNDLNIIISEANIYLATGDIVNAQKTIELAIEKDPKNPLLYFTLGSNYDQLIRKEGISEEERATLMQKAEQAYQKAIELKPDYFDAYYNMGALFFNEGVRLFEIADAITDMKLYEKEKVKFEAMWHKAMPFLEKAHEIDPKNIHTLVSLRILYARLSMNDKLKEVNEKIKVLQGQ